MNLQQKLGLGAVLCLGVITVVFSAIRVIVTLPGSTLHPEISWLASFSALESGVAVVVVCLTSFRVLVTQTRQGSSRRGYIAETGGTPRHARNSRGAAKISISMTRTGTIPLDHNLELSDYKHTAVVTVADIVEHGEGSGTSGVDWEDRTSQERIISPEGIRVQSSWRVTNE
jgi:hypothetical protein